MKKTSAWWDRALKVALLPLLVLMAAGCGGGAMLGGGGTPSLRLQSLASGRLYSRHFEKAYFSQSSDGEFDIVLIDEGEPASAAQAQSKDDRALRASHAAPLRQVVAIRVHWRPPHGTRADHPSAINAVVDWYVSGETGAAVQDRLHYQGAAFVRIDSSGKTARVSLRNGSLSLLESSGSLSDPVGASSIWGSFVARRDDTRVAAVTTPIRMESLARIRPAGSTQVPRSPGGE